MSTSFYENAWFIAVATILLTYLSSPILNVLVDWISSRRGTMTGTYLALTDDSRDGLLAERIACWQTGNRLTGRIHGVCRVRLSEGKVEQSWPVESSYKFSGRIAGSVLYLIYWEPRKAVNGGSITFKSTVMGDVLDGTWSGLDESQNISHAPCTWIRADKRNLPGGDLHEFSETINAALTIIPNRWQSKGTLRRKSLVFKRATHSREHPVASGIAMEIVARKGRSSDSEAGVDQNSAQPNGVAITGDDKLPEQKTEQGPSE